MEMDNFTFGMTLLVCGMGGTLVTLGSLFPEKPEKED
jgi:hypothetical protein